MNTIANVLVSARPEQRATDDSFWRIAIFCGVGLIAILCMAKYGLDFGSF
ncbi:MAG TPA: hypothetical protein VFW56_12835 [Bradyrhizobium sp.]|nr:hypothetical protein [Bradyrhizobium sp.]